MFDMQQIDRSPRLAGLDLNLLLALHALLSTCSVSLAARQLGRTQSATSHSLLRLREALGDPLLVRSGRGLVPTARALELQPRVAAAVQAVARVFEAQADFDPARSTRRFTIASPDLLAPLVPELLARLREQAPGLELSLELPNQPGALASGAVDLALGNTGDPALVRRGLGVVHPATVLRRGHPALDAKWGPGAWTRWPHVVVLTGNDSPNQVQARVDALGLQRQIGLVVPSFLMALHVVARTDLLYLAPRELLGDLPGLLGLELRPAPIPLPAIEVAMFWHPRSSQDSGHIWLREQLYALLRERLGQAQAG